MARITRKEQAELKALAKNVSNKKSYIRKTKGVEVVGVETKSVKQLEGMSRKQVNAYKETLKNFTKRSANRYKVKNEQGVVFEKREINKIENTIKKANKAKRKRKEMVEGLELKQGMKSIGKIGNQPGLMTKQKYADLRELKFDINRFKSKGDFDRYVGGKQKTYSGNFEERQDRAYKARYMRALRNVFGISETRDIVKKIREMPLNDFMGMYYTQLDMGDINYIYDPSEKAGRLSRLKEHFIS